MTITEHLISERYEIREILGEGGMGVVFRAYDYKTKVDVAIKALRETSNETGLQLFASEWRILASLAHPNIVDIRDVGEIVERQGRRPYFVMPLLSGRTLASVVENLQEPLDPARLIEIMRQVCRGLHAAHERGLIHRDLKPSNIFVMEDDTAKLIDFGVAHVMGVDSITGYKGTWQYMSPEQIDLGPATIESDIFALGVICYEVLTGIRPFARPNVVETASALRKHIPRPIHEVNPRISEALSVAIHKAMAKQPRQRYASAREFSEVLTRAFSPLTSQPADTAALRSRLERARQAYFDGDLEFASEIVGHLRADGFLSTDVSDLYAQIERSAKRKKISQLVEEARLRLQANEFGLGLNKVGEALDLDSDDVSVLAMRSVIEERQKDHIVQNYRKAAQEYLDRRDLKQARASLLNLLAVRPCDEKAALQLAEIELRDKEAECVRAECEACYADALQAHERGEFKTALEQIERALDLVGAHPDMTSSERDTAYRELYTKVAADLKELETTYLDIRQKLDDGSYSAALAATSHSADKYPGNDMFPALQLEIFNREARDLSLYLTGLCQAAEAEPDPETRAAIWTAGCERYPDQAFFQGQLKIAVDHRDMVEMLVSKARQYADRGQFLDALDAWKVLHGIYPQWPGLESEIAFAKRSRERQARTRTRSWIVRSGAVALKAGAFARAAELAREGLALFPEDPELHELEASARLGVEGADEARQLFSGGLASLSLGDVDCAISAMERALLLSERSIPIRAGLINALVRKLQDLRENSDEAGRIQRRVEELENHGDPLLRSFRVATQAGKPGSDAKQQAAAPVPEAAHPNAICNSVVEYLVETTRCRRVSAEAAAIKPLANKPGILRIGRLHLTAWVVPSAERIQSLSKRGLEAFRQFASGSSGRSVISLAIAVAAVGLLMAGIFWLRDHQTNSGLSHSPRRQEWLTVHIVTDPPDATVSIDSKLLGSRDVPLRAAQSYDLVVSRPGYQSSSVRQTGASSNWNFTLHGLPIHVRVFTTEQRGRLLLDRQSIGSLQNGDLPDYELTRDGHDHSMVLENDMGEVFSVRFQAPADAAPRVTSITNKELVVVSSLGSAATIYTGSSPTTASLAAGRGLPIPSSGLALTGISERQNRVNITGAQKRTIAIELNPAPVLFVQFRVKPDIGYLAVKTEAADAILRLDGAGVPARQPGRWVIGRPPGTYSMLLTADGFQDRLETVTIKKDAYTSRVVEMSPKPSLCTLRLSGATPGATVSIDHNPAGVVAASGSWESRTITPGPHILELRKPSYESMTRELRFTEPGQDITFEGSAVKLVELGMLDFRISRPLVQVRYRRIDEREDHAASPVGGVRVTAGKYEVYVSGPGFEPVPLIYDVAAGQSVAVAVALDVPVVRPAEPVKPPAAPVILFDNPGVLEHEGNWLRLKDGQLALLKTTATDLNFVLVRPVMGFLRSRKMELFIRCKSGETITYEFENRKLTRRIVVHGKVDVFSTPLRSSSTPISVLLHLRTGRVSLASDDGTQIDEVESPGSEFAAAKIGVKGDSLFLVRAQ